MLIMMPPFRNIIINIDLLRLNRMNLYFITGNKNKFAEVQSILPKVKQFDIDLPEIQDIDAKVIIKAKLLEAMKHKKGDFIVEDTSLYLDGLNGFPGPLIKWFMKALGNAGIFKLVEKLENSNAEAKTIIGYARSPETIHYFEGTIKGTIIMPKGDFGFGWDPIFQPETFSQSFAELTPDEKNKISMRRVAVNKLKEYLKNPLP